MTRVGQTEIRRQELILGLQVCAQAKELGSDAAFSAALKLDQKWATMIQTGAHALHPKTSLGVSITLSDIMFLICKSYNVTADYSHHPHLRFFFPLLVCSDTLKFPTLKRLASCAMSQTWLCPQMLKVYLGAHAYRHILGPYLYFSSYDAKIFSPI